MKNYVGRTLAVLFSVFFAASCVEEMHNPETVGPQTGVTSYTAYVEGPDAKSVLDGNVSVWKGDESIQVIGKSNTYKFSAYVDGKAESAKFNYAGSGSYNESEVMAVYPYGSGIYSGNLDERYVTNVTIPTKQNPVVDSYDPMAAIAMAHTTNDKMNFKNACALLKFTIGSEGVKNVTVYGDMNEVEIEGEMPDFYQEGNVYLTVGSEWPNDGARFAAYFFQGSTAGPWKSMTAVSGQTNMYTCAVPSGYSGVIFCRMNPNNATNGWDSKWNQTVDLSLSGGNHFTITNPWNGPDGNATGSWATFSAGKITTTAGIAGSGAKVYYNDGKPVIEGASEGYVSMTGDFIKGRTYYIAVAPTVLKNFSVEFSDVGDYDKYKVKSTSKPVTFKRNTIHDLGTLFSGKDTGFFTDPGMPDADKPCTIYYKAVEGDALYGYTGDVYVHIWLRNGTSDSHGPTWCDNSAKYRMTSEGSNAWSLAMEQSVREWFDEISPIGTTPVQKIGIIARNSDAGKRSEGDSFLDVYDSRYGVYMPEGLQHGINYIDNSTVTLVLYDRDNQGKSHDFCNLLWDENWWGSEDKPKKPLNYDSDSGCWWITLTGLNPDKQYKFQYQLGYGSDVTVTTFDPYTEIFYDRNINSGRPNDEWISSSTYPDVSTEYGDTHYGRDNGFVSAFKINKDIYDWKVADYRIEDSKDLVIYELLVRDFTDNAYGEGSIKAAMGQLDYLQSLGVNAVELMPVQEFDGNDSWGYGTHAYFSMDKAYGTRNDYKAFIDACHQRGMAVILDVVYNHATGAHPYALMYYIHDGDKSRPAPNNPWFNEYAPHPYSVYCDWNHSNPMVRDFVKRNLTYLIEEYKIDGFRFDLTKGLTQTPSDEGSASNYDQSRVDILNDYRNHIRWVDDNAVMICEHFADDENYELGKNDIMVWRNMNSPFIKAQKRDMSMSDFTGTTNTFDGSSGMMGDWQTFGQFVGYMESHDEQRTNYEAQWDYNGNSIDFATRIERAKINAAFFLLSPGPKMIWQFGEIGYDISIEDNGRTGKKPCKTAEYMAVKERKALYDTYAMLIKFRRDNPRFFDSDVNFRWYVGGSEQTGRYMFARSGEGKHFALFGNFGTGTQTIGVQLPEGVDKWYQYDNSSAVWSGQNHNAEMAEGQFYLLVSDPSMCLK